MHRYVMVIVIAYGSWLGMLLVHEAGHILHAILSGGQVLRVSLPIWGFSQTVVDPNPHELFVVWGGPIWGVSIPVAAATLMQFLKCPSQLLRFFAGFCCLANGAYIGLGPLIRAGDARDMLRLGASPTLMVAFGAVCVGAGLLHLRKTHWRMRSAAAHAARP